MTSLAKQLQRLAVQHTQSVFAPDKQRVSFLFDPKEAATLDKETIFSLGLSGLEELETVHETFADYESSLFNQSSQTWERSMQTKEVNEKLDQTLQKFLVELSPYVLLKAAHKALEWLIYRYHVHQYNVDDLMLCVLPYHDTKVFVRCLQLLKLDDPTNKWNWLESCAKEGVPLSRQTLTNHCKKDPGFLTFICDIVPKFIKVHGVDSKSLQPAISFFTMALLGALQYKDDINERVVSITVPYLVRGFKSKVAGFTASAYMILAQLVSQVAVKEDLLVTLLTVLTKKMKASLSKEAIGTICFVFQTQRQKKMPKKVFKYICRVPALIPMLSDLARQYDITLFLDAFLDRLLPLAVESGGIEMMSSTEGSDDEFNSAKPQYFSLLKDVLVELDLEKDFVEKLAKKIVTELVVSKQTRVVSESDAQRWRENVECLLGIIDRRYSEGLDTAMTDVLEEHRGNEAALEVLQEMVCLSTTSAKYSLIDEAPDTSLLLGLNHVQSSVRVLAVRQLYKLVNSQKVEEAFAANMLTQRLGDESHKVVTEVIQVKQVVSLVDHEELHKALLSIVTKRHSSQKWNTCVNIAINLLCHDLKEFFSVTLRTLLPQLILLGVKEARAGVAKLVMTSPAAEAGLLKQISKDWMAIYNKNEENMTSTILCQLNRCFVNGLAKAVIQMDTADREQMNSLESDSKNSCRAQLLFVMLLTRLCSTIGKKDKLNANVDWTQRLVDYLIPLLSSYTDKGSICEADSFGDDEILWQWMTGVKKSSALPLSICVWALRNVILTFKSCKISVPETDWLRLSEQGMRSVVMLLSALIKLTCLQPAVTAWRHLVNEITLTLDEEALHRILVLMWTHASATSSGFAISAMAQVGSFYLAQMIWRRAAGQAVMATVRKVIQDNPTVVLSLLMSLVSHHESVRSAAVLTLKLLMELYGDVLSQHKSLIKQLLKREEEVLADPTHTPLVIGAILGHQSVQDKSPKKGKKSSKETSLDGFMSMLKTADTPIHVKYCLLSLLKDVPRKLVIRTYCEVGSSVLDSTDDPLEMGHCHDIMQMIALSYDSSIADILEENSPEFGLLVKTLSDGPYQAMFLKQVKKKLFHSLPSLGVQKYFVSRLLDVGVSAEDASISQLIQEALKQVKLEAAHVMHEFKVMEGAQVTTVKGRKRTRTQKEAEPVNYKRLTVLLEVMQSRKKIEDSETMAISLFSLLSRLSSEEREDTEYCRQLVLTCLHHVTSQWSANQKPANEDAINVEILVQCMRGSSSPHTQHQALVVMATIAPLYPEYVLHNVMSVFTFVGSSLVQQDDNYSFQLIYRTIDAIIPTLLQNQRDDTEANKPCQMVIDILRVFVDARLHIARHRRDGLFRHLLMTVGVGEYLWILLALCVENSVRTKDVPRLEVTGHSDAGGSAVQREIEAVGQLLMVFDAEDQLSALSRLLHFLCALADLQHENEIGSRPKSKGHDPRLSFPLSVIQLSTLTAQQGRLIQFYATQMVPAILMADQFVRTVHTKADEVDTSATMATLFQNFMTESVGYLQKVAKYNGIHGNTVLSKFWRALLQQAYDILDKVKILLPSSVFLEAVCGLVQSELTSTLKRKALDLLNSKLTQLSAENLTASEVSLLTSLVESLLQQAKSEMKLVSRTTDSDVITTHQTAMFSLKLLCKLLGPEHPDIFSDLYGLAVHHIRQKSLPPAVVASSLLCLAELCSSMKVSTISHLSSLVPPLMKILHNEALLKGNDLVLLCSLTALQRLLASLPHFISPFLLDIILVTCELHCWMDASEEEKKTQSSARLLAVRQQLSSSIPTRVLVPTVKLAHSDLLSTNQLGLVTLMSILQGHIEVMSKENLSSQHAALVDFFVDALDLRNAENIQLCDSECEMVEDAVLSALLSMVIRLSENAFRPMFYKLYDWANQQDNIAHRWRQLVFFKLCDKLAEKLRSLFHLFAAHTFKQACQLLNRNNTMVQDVDFFSCHGDRAPVLSCKMVQYILLCLHKSFLYDTDGFINKEMFDLLTNPIVDQLENFIGGDLAYQERVTDQLTPCISQLAASTREDGLWRSLNYQICLKTRHSSAKVRFASLVALRSLAEKLGEEYMTLLPETIPFLAELMEDDSEEVEQECQRVVSALEELLGESLQKYF